MPYTAEINRSRPGCFLFLIDQSASMEEVIDTDEVPTPLDEPVTIDGMTYTHSVDGLTKSECVADVINRTIFDLVVQCTRHDGCRHYFDVGAIGYGGTRAASALGGALAKQILHPLPDFDRHPLRVDERREGRRVHKTPTWVEPRSKGDTPMCRAFALAAEVLREWCCHHPHSYPPIVINVTDGHSSDGDPEGAAERLRDISTADGHALLFNLFVDPSDDRPSLFTANPHSLEDDLARALFRMSSEFPDTMRNAAAERGHRLEPGARMFGFRAGPEHLVRCFEIATRASQLR